MANNGNVKREEQSIEAKVKGIRFYINKKELSESDIIKLGEKILENKEDAEKVKSILDSLSQQ